MPARPAPAAEYRLVARNTLAWVTPQSRMARCAASGSARGATHTPSYSAAKPSQRSRVRSACRRSRCSSGTENATTSQVPSHGAPSSRPNDKIRSAPSRSTAAVRAVVP